MSPPILSHEFRNHISRLKAVFASKQNRINASSHKENELTLAVGRHRLTPKVRRDNSWKEMEQKMQCLIRELIAYLRDEQLFSRTLQNRIHRDECRPQSAEIEDLLYVTLDNGAEVEFRELLQRANRLLTEVRIV
jgi:hypothetical protein